MSTPRYVIKQIGSRYVPVRQDVHPRMTRTAYLGWSGILIALGLRTRGSFRFALGLGGIALFIRGACGSDWIGALLTGGSKPDRNGPGNQAPSYQNDSAGRSRQMPTDLVDEQAMESFPASDPPARTSVTHS